MCGRESAAGSGSRESSAFRGWLVAPKPVKTEALNVVRGKVEPLKVSQESILNRVEIWDCQSKSRWGTEGEREAIILGDWFS